MFVGIGYDVHRLKKGFTLIMGGVKIPYKYGLCGHSDADVILHALMDALLGAAGLDDIGHLFPTSDNKYKGISSMVLLKKVMEKLKKLKYKVSNVDITVIAEQPKLSQYIPKMKSNIGNILNIDVDKIGLKATTNEGLGFIGRKQGIAAIAVACIDKRI